MNKINLPVLALLFCIWSCNQKRAAEKMTDSELLQHATALADSNLIVDGHVDLPFHLSERKGLKVDELKSILMHTSDGEFDIDRAKKGGLDAPFMSIYIPASYQNKPGRATLFADSLIDLVRSMPPLWPDQLALANSPDDVKANAKAGKISLPMGMENGAPIGNDLKNVQYFFDRGIRYITLTHSKYNQICGSSGDTVSTHQGLTAFGRDVVKEMNRVGIMVDISHVDDSTFYQVMKLTTVPCIASHSSCRYFAPMVKRDMTDDMIVQMGKNGGVILVNFYTSFIDSVARRQSDIVEAELKKKGLTEDDAGAAPYFDKLRKDYPVDIEVVSNHIDHIVKLAGIDHVGLGSDFDGVMAFLPTGLTDVSMYPNLIYSLLKRGYSENDIKKICGDNAMRVWQQSLDAARH